MATPNTPYVEKLEDREAYPVLQSLISGYFHQDADLLSDDSDEIVKAFREDASPGAAAAIQSEVDRFLERYGQDEHRLTRSFEQIFEPETSFHRFWGRTTRESLLRVVDIMAGRPTR